jgi:hypothetical protein
MELSARTVTGTCALDLKTWSLLGCLPPWKKNKRRQTETVMRREEQ